MQHSDMPRRDSRSSRETGDSVAILDGISGGGDAETWLNAGTADDMLLAMEGQRHSPSLARAAAAAADEEMELASEQSWQERHDVDLDYDAMQFPEQGHEGAGDPMQDTQPASGLRPCLEALVTEAGAASSVLQEAEQYLAGTEGEVGRVLTQLQALAQLVEREHGPEGGQQAPPQRMQQLHEGVHAAIAQASAAVAGLAQVNDCIIQMGMLQDSVARLGYTALQEEQALASSRAGGGSTDTADQQSSSLGLRSASVAGAGNEPLLQLQDHIHRLEAELQSGQHSEEAHKLRASVLDERVAELEQQLAVLNEGRAALLESLTCAAESGAGARAALSRAVDRAPPELAGSAVMDDLRKGLELLLSQDSHLLPAIEVLALEAGGGPEPVVWRISDGAAGGSGQPIGESREQPQRQQGWSGGGEQSYGSDWDAEEEEEEEEGLRQASGQSEDEGDHPLPDAEGEQNPEAASDGALSSPVSGGGCPLTSLHPASGSDAPEGSEAAGRLSSGSLSLPRSGAGYAVAAADDASARSSGAGQSGVGDSGDVSGANQDDEDLANASAREMVREPSGLSSISSMDYAHPGGAGPVGQSATHTGALPNLSGRGDVAAGAGAGAYSRTYGNPFAEGGAAASSHVPLSGPAPVAATAAAATAAPAAIAAAAAGSSGHAGVSAEEDVAVAALASSARTFDNPMAAGLTTTVATSSAAVPAASSAPSAAPCLAPTPAGNPDPPPSGQQAQAGSSGFTQEGAPESPSAGSLTSPSAAASQADHPAPHPDTLSSFSSASDLAIHRSPSSSSSSSSASTSKAASSPASASRRDSNSTASSNWGPVAANTSAPSSEAGDVSPPLLDAVSPSADPRGPSATAWAAALGTPERAPNPYQRAAVALNPLFPSDESPTGLREAQKGGELSPASFSTPTQTRVPGISYSSNTETLISPSSIADRVDAGGAAGGRQEGPSESSRSGLQSSPGALPSPAAFAGTAAAVNPLYRSTDSDLGSQGLGGGSSLRSSVDADGSYLPASATRSRAVTAAGAGADNAEGAAVALPVVREGSGTSLGRGSSFEVLSEADRGGPEGGSVAEQTIGFGGSQRSSGYGQGSGGGDGGGGAVTRAAPDAAFEVVAAGAVARVSLHTPPTSTGGVAARASVRRNALFEGGGAAGAAQGTPTAASGGEGREGAPVDVSRERSFALEGEASGLSSAASLRSPRVAPVAGAAIAAPAFEIQFEPRPVSKTLPSAMAASSKNIDTAADPPHALLRAGSAGAADSTLSAAAAAVSVAAAAAALDPQHFSTPQPPHLQQQRQGGTPMQATGLPEVALPMRLLAARPSAASWAGVHTSTPHTPGYAQQGRQGFGFAGSSQSATPLGLQPYVQSAAGAFAGMAAAAPTPTASPGLRPTTGVATGAFRSLPGNLAAGNEGTGGPFGGGLPSSPAVVRAAADAKGTQASWFLEQLSQARRDLQQAQHDNQALASELRQYKSLFSSLGGAPAATPAPGTGGSAKRRATADELAEAAGLQPHSPAAQIAQVLMQRIQEQDREILDRDQQLMQLAVQVARRHGTGETSSDSGADSEGYGASPAKAPAASPAPTPGSVGVGSVGRSGSGGFPEGTVVPEQRRHAVYSLPGGRLSERAPSLPLDEGDSEEEGERRGRSGAGAAGGREGAASAPGHARQGRRSGSGAGAGAASEGIAAALRRCKEAEAHLAEARAVRAVEAQRYHEYSARAQADQDAAMRALEGEWRTAGRRAEEAEEQLQEVQAVVEELRAAAEQLEEELAAARATNAELLAAGVPAPGGQRDLNSDFEFEIAGLQAQVQELEEEVEAYRVANLRLEEESVGLREATDDLKTEVAALREANSAYERARAESEGERRVVGEVEEERDRLAAQLAQAEAGLRVLDGDKEALEARVEELAGEVRQLQEQLQEAVEGKAAVEERAAGLEERVVELQTQLQEGEGRRAEAEGRVAGLEQRVAQLQTRLQEAEERAAGLEGRMAEQQGLLEAVEGKAEAEERAAELEERVAELQTQLQEAVVAVEGRAEAEERAAGLEGHVAELQTRLQEAEERAAGLKGRMAEQQELLEAVEGKAEAEERAAELEGRVAELRGLLEGAQQAEAQAQLLQHSVVMLEQQLHGAAVASEAGGARGQAATSRGLPGGSLVSSGGAERDGSELDVETAGPLPRVAQEDQAPGQGDGKAQQRQQEHTRALRQPVGEAPEEGEQLREVGQGDGEEQRQEHVRAVGQPLREEREEAELLREAGLRYAALEEQYTALQDRFNALSEFHEGALVEHGALHEQHDALAATHRALQDSHAELQARHATIASEHAVLFEQCKVLQDSHGEVEARYAAISNEHNVLLEQYRVLQDSHGELVGQHSVLEGGIAALRAEHDALNDEHAAQGEELRGAQARLAVLEAQLQAALEEAAEARGWEEQGRGVAGLQEQYSELQERYDELQGQHSQTQQQYSELQARYNELQGQHSQTQQQYSELQARYDAQSAEWEQLVAGVGQVEAEHTALAAQYEAVRAEAQALQQQYAAVQAELLNDATARSEAVQGLYEQVLRQLPELGQTLALTQAIHVQPAADASTGVDAARGRTSEGEGAAGQEDGPREAALGAAAEAIVAALLDEVIGEVASEAAEGGSGSDGAVSSKTVLQTQGTVGDGAGLGSIAWGISGLQHGDAAAALAQRGPANWQGGRVGGAGGAAGTAELVSELVRLAVQQRAELAAREAAMQAAREAEGAAAVALLVQTAFSRALQAEALHSGELALSEASQLRSSLADREARVSRLQSEVSQLRSCLVDRDAELASSQGELSEVEDAVFMQQAVVSQLEAECLELRSGVVEQQAVLARLEAERSGHEAVLADRQVGVLQLQGERAALEAAVAEQALLIEQLQVEKMELEAAVAEKEVLVVQLQGKRAELEAAVAGKEVLVVPLQGERAGLETAVAEKEVLVVQLQGERAELEAALAEKEVLVVQLQGERAELEATVAEKEVELATVMGGKADVEASAVGLEAEVRRLEAEVQEKGREVEGLREALEEKVQEAEAARKVVEQREQEVEQLREEVRDAKDGQAQMEQQCEAMLGVEEQAASALREAEEQEGALQQQLAEAEGRYAELQGQYEHLAEAHRQLEAAQREEAGIWQDGTRGLEVAQVEKGKADGAGGAAQIPQQAEALVAAAVLHEQAQGQYDVLTQQLQREHEALAEGLQLGHELLAQRLATALQERGVLEQRVEALEGQLRGAEARGEALEEQLRGAEERGEALREQLRGAEERGDEVQGQVVELREQREELKGQLKGAEERAEAAEARADEAQGQVVELREQREELQGRVKVLEEEQGALRLECEQAQVQLQAVTEHLHGVQQQHEQLQQGSEQLRQQHEGLRQQHDELQQQHEEAVGRLHEAEARLQQQQEAAAEAASRLKKELDVARQVVQDRGAEFEKAQAEAAAAKQEAEQAQERCAALDKELGEVRQAVEDRGAELEKVRAEAAAAKQEAERAQERYAALDNELHAARQEVEAAGAELEKVRAEAAAAKQEAAQAQERCAGLEQAAERQQEALRMERVQVQRECDDLRQECDALLVKQEEAEAMLVEIQAVHAEVQAAFTTLSGEHDALHVQHGALQERCEGLAQQRDEAKGLAGARAEAVAELEVKCDALGAELASSRAECDAAQRGAQVATAQLEEVNGQLEVVTAQLEEAKGQLEVVTAELEEVKGQMGEAKGQMEAMKGQMASLAEEHEALVEEHVALRDERTALEEKCGALQGQYGTVREEHEVLLEEHEQLVERYVLVRDERTALEERYGALEERFGALEEQHVSREALLVQLQEAHASAGLSASQTAERLQGALEASEAELSKAREELDAQRGAVAEMQEQIERLAVLAQQGKETQEAYNRLQQQREQEQQQLREQQQQGSQACSEEDVDRGEVEPVMGPSGLLVGFVRASPVKVPRRLLQSMSGIVSSSLNSWGDAGGGGEGGGERTAGARRSYSMDVATVLSLGLGAGQGAPMEAVPGSPTPTLAGGTAGGTGEAGDITAAPPSPAHFGRDLHHDADAFGSFLSAPRAVTDRTASNRFNRTSDGYLSYCTDVEALEKQIHELEDELHASRESYEQSNAALTRTNAQLILQVESMLAGEKLVKAQHEDELSRMKQHQEQQMERLRELQRQDLSAREASFRLEMDSVQVELQAREQRLGQLTAQLAAEQQQVRTLEATVADLRQSLQSSSAAGQRPRTSRTTISPLPSPSTRTATGAGWLDGAETPALNPGAGPGLNSEGSGTDVRGGVSGAVPFVQGRGQRSGRSSSEEVGGGVGGGGGEAERLRAQLSLQQGHVEMLQEDVGKLSAELAAARREVVAAAARVQAAEGRAVAEERHRVAEERLRKEEARQRQRGEEREADRQREVARRREQEKAREEDKRREQERQREVERRREAERLAQAEARAVDRQRGMEAEQEGNRQRELEEARRQLAEQQRQLQEVWAQLAALGQHAEGLAAQVLTQQAAQEEVRRREGGAAVARAGAAADVAAMAMAQGRMVAGAVEEVARLSQALEQLGRLSAAAVEEARALRGERDAARAQGEAAEAAVERVTAEREAAKTACQAAKAEKEAAKTACQAAEAEREAAVRACEAHRVAAAGALDRVAGLEAQLAAALQQVNALACSLDALQEEAQEQRAGHATAEERQAQLLREALQREASLSHETRGAHEEVARLRQLLRAAEDRCASLTARLADVQAQAANVNNEEVSAAWVVATEARGALEAEVAAHEELVAVLRAEGEELRGRVRQLEGLVDSLQAQLLQTNALHRRDQHDLQAHELEQQRQQRQGGLSGSRQLVSHGWATPPPSSAAASGGASVLQVNTAHSVFSNGREGGAGSKQRGTATAVGREPVPGGRTTAEAVSAGASTHRPKSYAAALAEKRRRSTSSAGAGDATAAMPAAQVQHNSGEGQEATSSMHTPLQLHAAEAHALTNQGGASEGGVGAPPPADAHMQQLQAEVMQLKQRLARLQAAAAATGAPAGPSLRPAASGNAASHVLPGHAHPGLGQEADDVTGNAIQLRAELLALHSSLLEKLGLLQVAREQQGAGAGMQAPSRPTAGGGPAHQADAAMQPAAQRSLAQQQAQQAQQQQYYPSSALNVTSASKLQLLTPVQQGQPGASAPTAGAATNTATAGAAVTNSAMMTSGATTPATALATAAAGATAVRPASGPSTATSAYVNMRLQQLLGITPNPASNPAQAAVSSTVQSARPDQATARHAQGVAFDAVARVGTGSGAGSTAAAASDAVHATHATQASQSSQASHAYPGGALGPHSNSAASSARGWVPAALLQSPDCSPLSTPLMLPKPAPALPLEPMTGGQLGANTEARYAREPMSAVKDSSAPWAVHSGVEQNIGGGTGQGGWGRGPAPGLNAEGALVPGSVESKEGTVVGMVSSVAPVTVDSSVALHSPRDGGQGSGQGVQLRLQGEPSEAPSLAAGIAAPTAAAGAGAGQGQAAIAVAGRVPYEVGQGGTEGMPGQWEGAHTPHAAASEGVVVGTSGDRAMRRRSGQHHPTPQQRQPGSGSRTPLSLQASEYSLLDGSSAGGGGARRRPSVVERYSPEVLARAAAAAYPAARTLGMTGALTPEAVVLAQVVDEEAGGSHRAGMGAAGGERAEGCDTGGRRRPGAGGGGLPLVLAQLSPELTADLGLGAGAGAGASVTPKATAGALPATVTVTPYVPLKQYVSVPPRAGGGSVTFQLIALDSSMVPEQAPASPRQVAGPAHHHHSTKPGPDAGVGAGGSRTADEGAGTAGRAFQTPPPQSMGPGGVVESHPIGSPWTVAPASAALPASGARGGRAVQLEERAGRQRQAREREREQGGREWSPGRCFYPSDVGPAPASPVYHVSRGD